MADWNNRGLRTDRGKAWKYQAFRLVLINPRMIGLVSRAVPVEGRSERPEGRWEIRRLADGSEARVVTGDRGAAGVGGGVHVLHRGCAAAGSGTARNTRRYLLSGLLRCGLCGAGCTDNGIRRTTCCTGAWAG